MLSAEDQVREQKHNRQCGNEREVEMKRIKSRSPAMRPGFLHELNIFIVRNVVLPGHLSLPALTRRAASEAALSVYVLVDDLNDRAI